MDSTIFFLAGLVAFAPVYISAQTTRTFNSTTLSNSAIHYSSTVALFSSASPTKTAVYNTSTTVSTSASIYFQPINAIYLNGASGDHRAMFLALLLELFVFYISSFLEL
jgi:hypothetical protein